MNRDPEDGVPQCATLPRDAWDTIEAGLRSAVRVGDDFVQIPFPRIASTSDRPIAAAVEGYKREGRVRDPRLSREVTCAFKATALSDLCDRLRTDTGIQFGAGSSVADEKVTLFCEKMPLREVMRQLSRPFGYTWLRSGKAGEWKYELVQDLRSQLLEEELRNRDRNAALLALEREMNRYRPYLDSRRRRHWRGRRRLSPRRRSSWSGWPVTAGDRCTCTSGPRRTACPDPVARTRSGRAAIAAGCSPRGASKLAPGAPRPAR